MAHNFNRVLQEPKVGQKYIEFTFNHIVIISQAHNTFLLFQECLILLQINSYFNASRCDKGFKCNFLWGREEMADFFCFEKETNQKIN